MNSVASRELCEQLAELSNWGFETSIDRQWNRNGIGEWVVSGAYPHVFEGQIPAYDLGYLLRKLPAILQLPNGVHQLHVVKDWFVVYEGYDVVRRQPTEAYKYIADSPEDAACKLAIKLFKSGVLEAIQEGKSDG